MTTTLHRRGGKSNVVPLHPGCDLKKLVGQIAASMIHNLLDLPGAAPTIELDGYCRRCLLDVSAYFASESAVLTGLVVDEYDKEPADKEPRR